MATGVYKRHRKKCASRAGRRCNCEPTWQAQAYDNRRGKLVTRSFPTQGAARGWRQDVVTALRSGVIAPRARSTPTVAQALEDLVAGMRDGSVLDRSGKSYKPSTIRTYDHAARTYLTPALGSMRLSDVRRADVQKFVDALRASLQPSTIHNKLDPLRVVYRRAIHDDVVSIDPTAQLELPRVRGRRERVAAPRHAEALLAALPIGERALWATALYAGLRIGELRALRWSDVDFDSGLVRVDRGWDDVDGEQDVKTDSGRRVVPLAGRLRAELVTHKLRTGRRDRELVFGRTATTAFVRSTIRRRSLDAWAAAGLEPLTPHEARHTCASYLIAAGLNPKQIQTYIGHSDVRTTFNVYGHLLPGDEAGAAAQIDAFLGAPGVVGTAP